MGEGELQLAGEILHKEFVSIGIGSAQLVVEMDEMEIAKMIFQQKVQKTYRIPPAREAQEVSGVRGD
ncbi:hypothetical protein GCM10007100_31170 [Roseibacillus persicicus]|uniref:Uncharacterized protein n=1 Tax=Roseibacillus persicicus TaxID=454148 RepID=A0A918TSY3_9BACT|nr:hypothetical protein GCM10007100_31170 [Roseibacillus persicicus]